MPQARMRPAAGDESQEVAFEEIRLDTAEFFLTGVTPLIMHRLSQKTRLELLLPTPRRNRNQAALDTRLKHDPVAEFRASVYLSDANAASAIHMPSGAFKKAIAQAAIDLPGVKRAAVGRLTSIATDIVDVFGLPRMFITMARQATGTPDMRTRAIFPNWACVLRVRYVASSISRPGLVRLVNAAGVVVGVGDWRSERGAGDFGQFQIVDQGDANFLRIAREQGRQAQLNALSNPVFHNVETAELMAEFNAELLRRGQATDSDLNDFEEADADAPLERVRPTANGGLRERTE